jgi:hypothetical protein
MFGAGIEYASGPDSLTEMANVSNTNYSNRGLVVNTLGLANTVVYHNFNLTYVRQIDADLSLNAQVGLVGVTNASAQNALADIFIRRHMGDHAEVGADGKRLPVSRPSDDGSRQCPDEL